MSEHVIEITSPWIKLDAALKLSMIALSGGEAKSMIGEGLVFVDGEPEYRRGRKVYPGSRIRCQDNVFIITLDENNG